MGIYQNLETLESNLYNAKKSLANALVGKGLDSNVENETLTQLIGKIDDIQTGEGGNPFSILGYTNTPQYILDAIDYTKTTYLGSYDEPVNLNFSRDSKLVFPPYYDTSNIIYMNGKFYQCYNLQYVPPYDTSKVTNMYYMFGSCRSLTSLDLSSFDTSNVTDMRYMFDDCIGLTTLNLNNWDTSKVESFENMFNGCNNLIAISLCNCSNQTIQFIKDRLNDAGILNQVTIETCGLNDVLAFAWSGSSETQTFKINNTTYTANTNPYETTLNDLGINEFTNASSMFNNKKEIISITSIPDTSNVTNMDNMFYLCSGLASLDLSNFNTSNVTSMKWMFRYCSGLTSLDLSSFDTSKVTSSMSSMFDSCKNLTSLNLSGWNTSNITDMNYMFQNCSGLTSLDLSSFDTSKVTSMQNMFYNCSGLTELHWNNFGNGSYTAVSFSNSSKLGINTDVYPNARQSLINMLATNSFDRATNGYSTCTVTLTTNTKAVLTEDEIAQITAKGFTVA